MKPRRGGLEPRKRLSKARGESPAGNSRDRRGCEPSYPGGTWGQHPKTIRHWWSKNKEKAQEAASPAPQEAGGGILLGAPGQ
jgi:hypothetical protein